jgi:hypothetical protein
MKTVVFSYSISDFRAAIEYVAEHNTGFANDDLRDARLAISESTLQNLIEDMKTDIVKKLKSGLSFEHINGCYMATAGFTVLSSDTYYSEDGRYYSSLDILVNPSFGEYDYVEEVVQF